jgi:lysophospholipase L1-like esterase
MKKFIVVYLLIGSLALNAFFVYKVMRRKYNVYCYQASKSSTTANLTNPKKVVYNMNRQDIYNNLPIKQGAIVFVGDSHFQLFPVNDFIPLPNVVNRGIGGDVTLGVLQRLDQILQFKPSKIVLEVGVNDILQGLSTIQILKNYNQIISNIKAVSPETKIYIVSLLPTGWYTNSNVPAEIAILKVNQQLCAIKDPYVNYINCYDSLVDDIGCLDVRFDCGDRLHLNYEGYKVLTNQVNETLLSDR